MTIEAASELFCEDHTLTSFRISRVSSAQEDAAKAKAIDPNYRITRAKLKKARRTEARELRRSEEAKAIPSPKPTSPLEQTAVDRSDPEAVRALNTAQRRKKARERKARDLQLLSDPSPKSSKTMRSKAEQIVVGPAAESFAQKSKSAKRRSRQCARRTIAQAAGKENGEVK